LEAAEVLFLKVPDFTRPTIEAKNISREKSRKSQSGNPAQAKVQHLKKLKIIRVTENKSIIKYWIWPAGYILFVFLLSSLPPGPFQRITFPHFDKAVHIIEYAILGYLLIRAGKYTASLSFKTLFLFVLVTGALIGGLDELYQSTVPGRIVSLGDWVFNLIGVIIGMTIFRRVTK
jgi:VanZ family protein